MAAGLQKEVEAGKMTKEAALAEFGKRANTLTYDKGSGYLFGIDYGRHHRAGARSQADRHEPHGRGHQRPAGSRAN